VVYTFGYTVLSEWVVEAIYVMVVWKELTDVVV
jgi:hypothetical protein